MSKRLARMAANPRAGCKLVSSTLFGINLEPLTYPVIVSRLSELDGGGFAVVVPDLPGCMSDGETPEEAIANVSDAIETWLEAARDAGRTIPTPSRVAAIA
jgi:predicted RNase H-like HicB family nuclease